MSHFRAFLPDGPSPLEPNPPAVHDARVRRSIRRIDRRPHSDAPFLRQSVQVGFLLLNLWIGALFYTWVRFYETGGQTLYVTRPPGVEGWLPIAALMNLKYTVTTWSMPPAHAAGMVLLVGFLAVSLVFRKAFCSWLCPVGTLSEWLWKGGVATFGRTFDPPRWLDIPLRSLKYVLLGLFLYAVGSMSAEAIRAFLSGPYGMVADVKMLDFFRHMGRTGIAVCSILVIASVFVKNAWCRFLCPYGALTGLVALFSPMRIRRNPDTCIDCAKCAKACPSRLPVDRLLSVRSAECTSCFQCVVACPVRDALNPVAARRIVPGWAVATGVLGIVFGLIVIAQVTGHWHTLVPDAVLFDLIPRAAEFGHP